MNYRPLILLIVLTITFVGMSMFLFEILGTNQCQSSQATTTCTGVRSFPVVDSSTVVLRVQRGVGFRLLHPSNFTRLRNLDELAIVQSDVEELSEHTFQPMKHLRRLDLSDNNITHLRANRFKDITDLEYLILSGNPIVEVSGETFYNMKIGRLELVHCTSQRHIANNAFVHSRISTIVFAECNLDRITRETFAPISDSIRNLTIVDNLSPLVIDNDAFDGFKLHQLVLTNNSIMDAGFLLHGDHDEIVLDNNRELWTNSTLSDMPVEKKNTRRLSVSNTMITDTSSLSSLRVFSELEELILSHNMITAFSATDFVNFQRLRILDLSHNRIRNIVCDCEKTLTKLEKLNLNNNDLRTIDEETTKPLFDRLQMGLTLAGNPLEFNCELRWLSKWLVASKMIVDEIDWQCHPPTIFNVTREELENGDVQLECFATGIPEPEVFWTSDRSSNSLVLLAKSFSELRASQTGNYTCCARNSAGQTTLTVSISVPERSHEKMLKIINSPGGFFGTCCLLFLLACALKNL